MAKNPEPPKAATERPHWGVIDTNAIMPDGKGGTLPRTHESRRGRQWPLNSYIPTKMPEADARVFLRDTAFIVTDHEGNVVPSISVQQMARMAPPGQLPADQVIAKLEELTTASLLTRAGVSGGGGMFDADTPRETLIDFLMNAYQPEKGTSDYDADDLPANMAGRLLAEA